MTKLQPLLPGLLTATLVAIAAKILAIWVPQLGGATLAILLGIALGNLWLHQPALAHGTKFAESRLLEYSVCLLGLTVTFQTIAKMGWRGVVYILFEMTLVITGAYLLGKRLGFSETSSLMMAGGNAVCGSSAIGAIAPAIGAPDEEKGEIITLVNLLGTVMLLTLPFLGAALFGSHALATSALVGGTLQSVGQVVAGASLLNPHIVNYAMLFKITRIIMLVVVVTVFTRKAQAAGVPGAGSETKRLPIPWYVLLFLLFCILNSTMALPPVVASTAHVVSGWFETIALAAIGLRLDFRKFMQQGARFLAYGLGVGAMQTGFALGLLALLRL